MDNREYVHHHGETGNKGCLNGNCSFHTKPSAFFDYILGHWVAAIVAAITIIIIICFIVWVVLRGLRSRAKKDKKKNGKGMLASVFGSMWDREPCGPDFQFFPFVEIQQATNDFDRNNVLGKGAQGEVFQGILADNRKVAIKKLRERAIEEFRLEISMLKDIRHHNVVLLLGCSFDDVTKTPYLVFEYLPGGNLFQLIHRSEDNKILGDQVTDMTPEINTWLKRHYIATQVAEGLAYLHSKHVLHRDIKSANILLNTTLEPKIADFGIAKRTPQEDEAERKMSEIKGTFVYTCPEYCRDAEYTAKCDTYSFGVLLAELLTGLHAVFNKDGKIVDLATHFLATSKTNLESILATEIADSDEITMPVISRVASLVHLCMNHSRDKRPDMKEVLEKLQKMQQDLMVKASESSSDLDTYPMLGDRLV